MKKTDRKDLLIFQLNDEKAKFEEIEVPEDKKLYEILDSSFALLILDPPNFVGWTWLGSEISTRMKILAATRSLNKKYDLGLRMKMKTADEGSEPDPFKFLVGLIDEITPLKLPTPQIPLDLPTEIEYKLEEIILLLEKAGVPDGYKREMVFINGKLYKYHVYNREFNGQLEEQKELIPLIEKVPDGSVVLDSFIPRLLFSFNDIKFIDFLKTIS